MRAAYWLMIACTLATGVRAQTVLPPAEAPVEEMTPPPEGTPPPNDTEGDGSSMKLNEIGPEAPDLTPTAGFDVVPEFSGRLYGFIDSFFEADAPSPTGDGANGAAEFDIFNFNVMAQGTILGTFRYFFNLNAPGSGSPTGDTFIALRNAWVEVPLIGDAFVVRAGKTYRRFGLYNEILDATPTFIGIEPPELFDSDHLMLTRTTNLMVHGRLPLPIADTAFAYALMTGNDETKEFALPVGVDARVQRSSMGSDVTFGSSFYWTGGIAAPSVDIGDGSPIGGVANWMAEDNYFVYGGFVGVDVFNWIVQVEGWRAEHTGAKRDPALFLAMLPGAGLESPGMKSRFGLDPKLDTSAIDPETTDPKDLGFAIVAPYAVTTAYLRLAHRFEIPWGDREEPVVIIPYGQFDWYLNPEIVANEDVGGDNEAGLSDDGMFYKETLGIVIKPTNAVALKVDGSVHHQTFDGRFTFYPEIRISFSYYWELAFQ